MKKIMLAFIMLIAVSAAIFAGAQTEAPEIEIDSEGVQYFSPNGDGVKDTAQQSFSVTLYVKSEDGYVPEYGISITDEEGNVYWRESQSEQSDVNWFMRLFRGFTEFTLERTVRWDGTTLDGDIASDGEYSVDIWVQDATGNRVELELEGFILDTQAPTAELSIDQYIFSPNGDGTMEELTISQELSNEQQWQASFINSDGEAVRNYTWTDSPPQELVWDGTDDSGELVSDGQYSYTISATDRAGNSTTATEEGIVLDTTESGIQIQVDNEYISPNGDGLYEQAEFAISYDTLEGLEHWTLTILDPGGETWYSEEGSENPPTEYTFHGVSEDGDVLREGPYRIGVRLEFTNGFITTEFAQTVIDVTDPQVQLRVQNPVFSPNNDGRDDVVRFEMRATERVTWTGKILDSEGNVVRETSSDYSTYVIVWNGKDQDGNTLPEGEYTLEVEFTDIAGNSTTLRREGIEIDLTPPDATLSANRDYLTPIEGEDEDTISFTISSEEDEVSGYLYIRREDGSMVRSTFINQDSDAYRWNGTLENGSLAPDGMYYAVAHVTDAAGNTGATNRVDFSLDTSFLDLNAPAGFSPNGDGIYDELELQVEGDRNRVMQWTLDIRNEEGDTVHQEEGTEQVMPETLVWDGENSAGEIVEGSYVAVLDIVSRTERTYEVSSDRFELDVTPPDASLDVTQNPFEETDQGAEGQVFITIDAEDVFRWDMDIVSPDGDILRSYSGEGNPRDEIAWNGESTQRVESEDLVNIHVELVDEFGNRSEVNEETMLDLLVIAREGRLYLMVPNIIFGAYQHTLDSAGEELYERNMDSINRIVDIFQRFPNYDLLLEGHALNVFEPNTPIYRREEQTLLPLTQRRVNSVQRELIEAGMDPERIEVTAFGGTQPMVPVDDEDVNWKNRRVEFVMVRNRPN
ncbi:MAG: FlgD immunoglobulin-like domain containing protein [Spirochaetia bacterium]